MFVSHWGTSILVPFTYCVSFIYKMVHEVNKPLLCGLSCPIHRQSLSSLVKIRCLVLSICLLDVRFLWSITNQKVLPLKKKRFKTHKSSTCMSDFSEASRTKKYFPWRKKDSKHTNQVHVCLINLKHHGPKSTSPKEKGFKTQKSSMVDLWPEYCVFQVSFFCVCFNKASNLFELLASFFIYFDKWNIALIKKIILTDKFVLL